MAAAEEVAADVELVWAACRKFNADGSDIVAAADSSEAAFLQRWQAAGELRKPKCDCCAAQNHVGSC